MEITIRVPSTFGLGFNAFLLYLYLKYNILPVSPSPFKGCLRYVCKAVVDLLVKAKESEKIVNKSSAKMSQRDLKFCEKGYHHDANMWVSLSKKKFKEKVTTYLILKKITKALSLGKFH